METRAAVAHQAGQPLSIETVNLEGPRDGECLVEIKATRRQSVNIRRWQRFVARIGQIIPAQLIRHDKQNISYCRHGNRSSNHHRI